MKEDKLIVLVRHLKTEFNESGFNMGRANDAGIIEDADGIGELREKTKKIKLLLGKKMEKIGLVSSPLKRCLQTAEIVKEELGVTEKIVIMKDLIETDMGDFTGKNARQIRKEYGDLVDKWMWKPETFTFPNGESYREVKERGISVLSTLEKDLEKKDVIFVFTHVDLIKTILLLVLGASFNLRRNLNLRTGSFSLLKLIEPGKFRIEGVNLYP